MNRPLEDSRYGAPLSYPSIEPTAPIAAPYMGAPPHLMTPEYGGGVGYGTVAGGYLENSNYAGVPAGSNYGNYPSMQNPSFSMDNSVAQGRGGGGYGYHSGHNTQASAPSMSMYGSGVAMASNNDYYGGTGHQDGGGGGGGFVESHYGEGGGGEDVVAYDGGGRSEPYGSRGVFIPTWDSRSGGGDGRRQKPDVEEVGGAQRYRVKLVQDGESSNLQQVLCQIGLDGVRVIDGNGSRTLKIYPLENIIRWSIQDGSVFTFWAKSPVDVEQRAVKLQSNNATATAMLDTLTAACAQLSEMVENGGSKGRSSSGERLSFSGEGSSEGSDAANKKGATSLIGWVAPRRLLAGATIQEEKQHWVPDEAAKRCTSCQSEFTTFLRRHHCRNCGDIFCDKCTLGRTPLTNEDEAQLVRVCDRCLAEVTQRLTNSKPVGPSLVSSQRTHEDLAKKLQEELEKNTRRGGGGGGATTTSSSRTMLGGNGDGDLQASVFTCPRCGTVSIVSSENSRCSSCGFEGSGLGMGGGGGGGSGGGRQQQQQQSGPVPLGPPHLWPSSMSGGRGGGGDEKQNLREYACPTCTVHLQVQVPSFGTETIECGVCGSPFLVSANG